MSSNFASVSVRVKEVNTIIWFQQGVKPWSMDGRDMKKVCLCVCVCGGGKLFFSGNSFEKFAMLSPYSAVHYIYTARFIFTLKIFGVEVKSYYAPPPHFRMWGHVPPGTLYRKFKNNLTKWLPGLSVSSQSISILYSLYHIISTALIPIFKTTTLITGLLNDKVDLKHRTN